MTTLVRNLLLITGIIICVLLELILSYIAGENIIAQLTISFIGGLVIGLLMFSLISGKKPQPDIEKKAKKCELNEWVDATYMAEEVRNLVQNKTNYNYGRILSLIKVEAKEGRYATDIKYNSDLFHYESCMKQPLEELGYTVTEEDDKVIISWY